MPDSRNIGILEEGQRVLRLEAEAIFTAAGRLDSNFVRAVELIHGRLREGGKIIVSGIGKSGNVAQKLASTLTSTGSMAIFLHPVEALHGDLGIVGSKDVFLMFSHSGATEELLQILPAVKGICGHAVAVLGNTSGVLARHAELVIDANIPKEACPNNLAPTTSSTLQMAIGDALAMCLQQLAGFSEEHFAKLHPGGSLGRRLTTAVADIMHGEGRMAMLGPDAAMEEIIIALTDTRLSGVDGKAKSGKPKLAGVITEGDIRRSLLKKEGFFDRRASDVMTRDPITVSPETKTMDALKVMENRSTQLSFLPVVDDTGGCVGVLRLHDLVLTGLS